MSGGTETDVQIKSLSVGCVLTAHTHQVCEDTDLGEKLKRPPLRLTTLGETPVRQNSKDFLFVSLNLTK